MIKILSVIMLAIIALGMPIISLAAEDEIITQDSEEKSGKITVDYNMGVTYTVTIPASVTFTDAEKTVERGLLVDNVSLNEGSILNVNVASLNTFQMRNGEAYIDYDLRVNYDYTLGENDINILTVEAGEGSGWVVLYFVTELEKDNAFYAGKYTDTLTFTITID
ncbi:MAG: hypothetical protein J1E64_05110 [Acetatifactor sp.]|nr:hypothetical protein [Acetatifactor sp.]